MTGFWYLATPYSKHPRGQDIACQEAIDAAVICIRAGLIVFSPIAHTHAIAVQGGLAGHYEQWAQFDETMILASCGLIVVEMDGWQESTGIAAEIELAELLGKPIHYMPPSGPAPVVFAQ